MLKDFIDLFRGKSPAQIALMILGGLFAIVYVMLFIYCMAFIGVLFGA